ncbi:hypothetical protein Kpho02_48120 [Kitasatospora phosalacinea]|uniref:Uncharacterized protein n=1 Tax=Kitasatospora phosalacinea TaxID=2065 RepID=A0A9W6V3S6_9ACTN|nr:hypothetical protein [Kitasatospora phosalacinea]GLW72513.1 hypothetical protein Kpho02_48120 [Kitasatospora phosalacinea]
MAADRGPFALPPLAARGFTDADGCRWRLLRGPPDRRRAKRLAVRADVMATGDHDDERPGRWVPRSLPAAERPAARPVARAAHGADGLLSHPAYEFTADDGRGLLLVETSC